MERDDARQSQSRRRLHLIIGHISGMFVTIDALFLPYGYCCQILCGWEVDPLVSEIDPRLTQDGMIMVRIVVIIINDSILMDET